MELSGYAETPWRMLYTAAQQANPQMVTPPQPPPRPAFGVFLHTHSCCGEDSDESMASTVTLGREGGGAGTKRKAESEGEESISDEEEEWNYEEELDLVEENYEGKLDSVEKVMSDDEEGVVAEKLTPARKKARVMDEAVVLDTAMEDAALLETVRMRARLLAEGRGGILRESRKEAEGMGVVEEAVSSSDEEEEEEGEEMEEEEEEEMEGCDEMDTEEEKEMNTEENPVASGSRSKTPPYYSDNESFECECCCSSGTNTPSTDAKESSPTPSTDAQDSSPTPTPTPSVARPVSPPLSPASTLPQPLEKLGNLAKPSNKGSAAVEPQAQDSAYDSSSSGSSVCSTLSTAATQGSLGGKSVVSTNSETDSETDSTYCQYDSTSGSGSDSDSDLESDSDSDSDSDSASDSEPEVKANIPKKIKFAPIATNSSSSESQESEESASESCSDSDSSSGNSSSSSSIPDAWRGAKAHPKLLKKPKLFIKKPKKYPFTMHPKAAAQRSNMDFGAASEDDENDEPETLSMHPADFHVAVSSILSDMGKPHIRWAPGTLNTLQAITEEYVVREIQGWPFLLTGLADTYMEMQDLWPPASTATGTRSSQKTKRWSRRSGSSWSRQKISEWLWLWVSKGGEEIGGNCLS